MIFLLYLELVIRGYHASQRERSRRKRHRERCWLKMSTGIADDYRDT